MGKVNDARREDHVGETVMEVRITQMGKHEYDPMLSYVRNFILPEHTNPSDLDDLLYKVGRLIANARFRVPGDYRPDPKFAMDEAAHMGVRYPFFGPIDRFTRPAQYSHPHPHPSFLDLVDSAREGRLVVEPISVGGPIVFRDPGVSPDGVNNLSPDGHTHSWPTGDAGDSKEVVACDPAVEDEGTIVTIKIHSDGTIEVLG